MSDTNILMEACKNHPERQQIFSLEKMLYEAGYPYFFNFREELRPVFGGDEDGDPESINWDCYRFLIEIGQPVAHGLSQISVCFNQKGNRELLELLDMSAVKDKRIPTAEDGDLHVDMTAEDCMKIIEEFFNSLPPVQSREDEFEDWDDEEDEFAIPEHLKQAISQITGISSDKLD